MEDRKDRALRWYLAFMSDMKPKCDFCSRPLAEGESYRHQACNTIRSLNFGARL